MVVMLPLDATSGTPAFTAQQTRQALSALAGIAPSGRPLGASSGVRQGTPTTTASLSGAGSTTWNVATFSGVLDTQTSAAAGPYFFATDGSDTGTITAANATNPRIDILYVKVNDTVQDGSGLTSGQVLYLAGTPAASPSAPATPARGMAIAQISVPKSGSGNPTISWVAPTFGGMVHQAGKFSLSAGSATASGLAQAATVTFPIQFAAVPVHISASIMVHGNLTSFWLPSVVDLPTAVTATSALIGIVNISASSQPAFSGVTIGWHAVGVL